MKPSRSGWTLNSMASPQKKRETDTQAHWGGRVKAEGEIGEMDLQAKEHQGLPANTKSQEREKKQMLPEILQKESTLMTPDFVLKVSRTVRLKFRCFTTKFMAVLRN